MKLVNKKNAWWYVVVAALFVAVLRLGNAISTLADVEDEVFYAILHTIPSLIWVLAAMALIVVGVLAKKDNARNCGIFVASTWAIGAFTSAFSNFANAYDMFETAKDLESSYKTYASNIGLYQLFFGLAMACVAAAFIIWLLNKFFGVKSNEVVVDVLAICTIVFMIVSIIFMFVAKEPITNEPYYACDTAGKLSAFANIAYVVLFYGYACSNREASKTTKKSK